MTWQVWLKGLISAIIGGAANSITVYIVEPTTFNLQEGASKLGWVALVSAIVAAAMYLKSSPLPNGNAK
jgi:type IV secretory pathway VirB2 component (pilin)